MRLNSYIPTNSRPGFENRPGFKNRIHIAPPHAK